jgi:hypothetical protein
MLTDYTSNKDVLDLMYTMHDQDLFIAFKSHYDIEQCEDIFDFYDFLDNALDEGYITQDTYNDVIAHDIEIAG